MPGYRNRYQAGEVLANALARVVPRHNSLILALPRGGVPVAAAIAKTLQLPMDVILVRKLAAPEHPEFALGALTLNTPPLWNRQASSILSAKQQAELVNTEYQELIRRNQHYRQGANPPELKHKTLVVVDDGIATGATLKAALATLQPQQAEKIIVAVPVAPADIVAQIIPLCDQLICPLQPSDFTAVGQWYGDFAQCSDAEVLEYLSAHRHS
ncbi:MAG: phosphoribosyltransferase [Legionellaceae bacterium]|nr:phosphoribosyltransferase [Legionellaceae bacterium]